MLCISLKIGITYNRMGNFPSLNFLATLNTSDDDKELVVLFWLGGDISNKLWNIKCLHVYRLPI